MTKRYSSKSEIDIATIECIHFRDNQRDASIEKKLGWHANFDHRRRIIVPQACIDHVDRVHKDCVGALLGQHREVAADTTIDLDANENAHPNGLEEVNDRYCDRGDG